MNKEGLLALANKVRHGLELLEVRGVNNAHNVAELAKAVELIAKGIEGLEVKCEACPGESEGNSGC